LKPSVGKRLRALAIELGSQSDYRAYERGTADAKRKSIVNREG